jgi:hypothetical protein
MSETSSSDSWKQLVGNFLELPVGDHWRWSDMAVKIRAYVVWYKCVLVNNGAVQWMIVT